MKHAFELLLSLQCVPFLPFPHFRDSRIELFFRIARGHTSLSRFDHFTLFHPMIDPLTHHASPLVPTRT